MKLLIAIILTISVYIFSCNSDSVTNTQNQNKSYSLIYTATDSNKKIEVYNAISNKFVYGYNDLGIKFFLNNSLQTSGWIKFKPKMYHNFPNSPMHSSPVSGQFNYDNNNGMFMGYACFIMITDSAMTWYGFFNHNDQSRVDSVIFTVESYSKGQVRSFNGANGSGIYHLTLVSPYEPGVRLNTFKCLLHRTDFDLEYDEITSGEMFIKPWMPSMGHGSSSNVNPIYQNGFWQGYVNFTMSGAWNVYDSIKVNGQWITPAGNPPYFSFTVQ